MARTDPHPPGEPGTTRAVLAALAALPRLPLMDGPTPLQPLLRLSQALGGGEIWLKRDDLIGFGLGGNKIRGLELLVADALAQGATCLVTGAGAQSNHVRATAAAAAYRGLRCIAVYWGEPPPGVEGNYRLIRMWGAECVFTGDPDRASVDRGIPEACARLRAEGQRPYPIPRGGACALGALGHALAAYELHSQCARLGWAPDLIVLATGSGGTHAGWLLGTQALGASWRIESYTVSREAEAVQGEIARLATEAAALLGLAWHFGPDVPCVHGGWIGAGYGIPSAAAAAAIRLVGRMEGVLLDPTYTGKAMAGLLHRLGGEGCPDRRIVFLHTGGQPAFFAGAGDWLG
jgi:1-aminocyclopropane-1-carboxylate deaminase/D-cysteine desulfhydrase-like pyridoxal-dependent ACC family enzyme